MTDWRFFDANCVVGRHMKLGPGGLHAAADLLADKRRILGGNLQRLLQHYSVPTEAANG